MIVAQGLTRSYGTQRAIEDVSFRVDRGEVVGFLGPNGAGKSTTMKILTGALSAERGEASIAGFSLSAQPDDAKRHVGYLPETTPLYDDMTPRAFVSLAGRLRTGRAVSGDEIGEALTTCGLDEVRDRRIGKLSRGYRQRVGLAQAIVHRPDCLILDEPTSGIDPVQMAGVKRLIRSLAQDRAILLSSHNLGEIAEVCDRVIIVSRGRIVAEDRIANLSHLVGGVALRLRIEGPPEAVTGRLAGLPAVLGATFNGAVYLVTFEPGARPQREIVRAIVAEDWTLLAMEEVGADLEAVFLHYADTRAGHDA